MRRRGCFQGMPMALADRMAYPVHGDGRRPGGPGERDADVLDERDRAVCRGGGRAVGGRRLGGSGLAGSVVGSEPRPSGDRGSQSERWVGRWWERWTRRAASSSCGGLEPETPYTFRLRFESTDGCCAPGSASAQVSAPEYSEEFSVTTGAYTGPCRSGGKYLCLRSGRFELRADWTNPDQPGDFGAGTAVPVDISDESGLFWFFESGEHRVGDEGAGRQPIERSLLDVLRRAVGRGVLADVA